MNQAIMLQKKQILAIADIKIFQQNAYYIGKYMKNEMKTVFILS